MKILKNINIMPIVFILNIISSFIGSYSINYIFTLAILIIIFTNIYKYKINRNMIYLKEMTLMMFCILFIISATLISIFTTNNINQLIKLIILVVPLIIGILLTIKFGKLYIERGLIYISHIMTLINIFGIFEFINKKNMFVKFVSNENTRLIINGYIHTINYRTSTVFTNSIVYATILVIVFWINIYLIKNIKLKYLNIFIIIINIYATRSRSAWIALLITIIMYMSIRIKKNIYELQYKMILKDIIFIFLAIMIANTNVIRNIINEIIARFMELNTTLGSVSATQRLGTISYIVKELYNQSLLNLFIGNGFNSVHDLMANKTIEIIGFITTDNQYLSIIWEFGLLGFILILYILISLLIKNLSIKTKINPCIVFILVSICICMFFYEIFYWPIISQLFFICIGALIVKDKAIVRNSINY